MAKKLPKGWVETTLGEMCMPVASVRPESTPAVEITYFDIGGIDNQTSSVARTQTIAGRDAPSRARQAVQTGDILFSTVRTYLRNIAMVEREYPNPVASTGFTVIRPAPGVLPRFVFHQVLSERFLQPLHDLQTGTSYPAVRDRDVLAQSMRLAPTAEQERIVAKLDATFARLDAGEKALRRGRERLKRYRSAVLNAAVTGELTKEWRKGNSPEETGAQLLKRLLVERRKKWEAAELAKMREKGKEPRDDKWKARYSEPQSPDTAGLPGLPKGWAWATVGQCIADLHAGTTIVPSSSPSSLPVLRSSSIRPGTVALDDVRYIPEAQRPSVRSFLAAGDLLFTRLSGSAEFVGACAVVPPLGGRVIAFPDRIFRAQPLCICLGAWLAAVFQSSRIRTRIEQRARSTAGHQRISLSDVADQGIPLPPAEEQEAIEESIESRLSAADGLAAAMDRQLATIRQQRQVVLRDAFAGRLVAQDPADEPASTLLDRIRQDAAEKRGVACSHV